MNAKLPQAVLALSDIAEIVSLEKGAIIKKQFERVTHFYVLLEGTVHFHQLLSTDGEEILAGKSHSAYAPIGMDAFISPYRNETTAVVDSSFAKLIKWNTDTLVQRLEQHSITAINFFKFINHHSNRFIGDTSGLFSSGSNVAVSVINEQETTADFVELESEATPDLILFLLQSPFFEIFEEQDLKLLTANMQRRHYQKGDLIIDQGEVKKGVFILESGVVQYARQIFDIESGKKFNVPFRSISTPGYLVSSSTLLGVVSAMNAFATEDSIIRYIPSDTLSKTFEDHIEFELQFQKRILWLINNQLRAVRTRLITSQFNDEEIVANTLITGNNTKISVRSDLHKVPALLTNKNTIPIALDILHEVEIKGQPAEKNLASLCLDNLLKTQKESEFYQALLGVYSTTVESDNTSNKALLHECMQACKKAFTIPSIYVKGLENIPAKPGAIFIYNHLSNDEYYTLPNQFQITLDSHYLSYLLYEIYGQLAQRVVRLGKREEFGHEDYYNKFNFINVITRDSDHSDQSNQSKKEALKNFNAAIKYTLVQGKNIIISPEGVSHSTEMSPTQFKAGIFKLIQALDFEPLIVPVVMANFDKRISDKKFACEIKKPFKLSAKLRQYKTKDLSVFLKAYQAEYREYVEQLVSTIETENSAQFEFDQEVKALRRRMLSKRNEEGLMAFYGSSTLRLWENMPSDLGYDKAINFGFGGSTYEWCLHYFRQLFKGIYPSVFVLYGGDNDLANGRTPEDVLRTVKLLIERIKQHVPQSPIAIISVKPSPSRTHLQPSIITLNEQLKSLTHTDTQLHWIDTYTDMRDKNGKVRTELFVEDMLHLNESGYECWSEAVRTQLLAAHLLKKQNP
ncbi:GDSL-type esterase/lipase family protein [Reichenbachiella sp.]|uniref:GDSL-type esterase/lipase family protein n=1 Tax=Reichenbachiella sp. TaxID=2184521 RepID=UPI003B5A94D6